MMSFAIVASIIASCPDTVKLNTSGHDWNTHDAEIFGYCTQRCAVIYPENYCLKTFIKYSKNKYDAICGALVSKKVYENP